MPVAEGMLRDKGLREYVSLTESWYWNLFVCGGILYIWLDYISKFSYKIPNVYKRFNLASLAPTFSRKVKKDVIEIEPNINKIIFIIINSTRVNLLLVAFKYFLNILFLLLT